MDAPPLPVIESPRRNRSGRLLGTLIAIAVLIGIALVVRVAFLPAFRIESHSMAPTLKPGDSIVARRWEYRRREPRRGDIVVFDAPPEATDDRVEGIRFVFRVVGLPGETVEVRAAALEIDGEDYDDSQFGVSVHDFLRSRLNLPEESAVKIAEDAVRVDGKRTVTRKEIGQALHVSKVSLVPGRVYIDGKPLDEPYTNEDPGYGYAPRRIAPDEVFVLGDNRNRARDSHIWGALKRDRIVGPIH